MRAPTRRCRSLVFASLVSVACASPGSGGVHTPAPSAPSPAKPDPAPATAPTPTEPTPTPAPTEPTPIEPTPTPADPTGLTPPPIADPELAALPVDVRIASMTAVLTTHRKDCKAFARRSACELVADLDGDGKKDRAIKIRDRATKRAGIAIAWADGSVSIIGAGARSRLLSTDVHMEGVDLGWEEASEDYADDVEDGVDTTWGVARRKGDGLERAVPRRPAVHRAPGVTGDGIWMDGGDAVQILYWDGARWRWLILGF